MVLLVSTLIPIVKDPLSSMNSSKNYRSVCLSSLVIKMIDWIVIILGGKALGLSELQFAYQTNCSTTQCTWAALETIDYFLKRGSEVFTIATNMSKAFDLTLHTKMFLKMFKAKLAPILVRLLIYMYIEIKKLIFYGTPQKSQAIFQLEMELVKAGSWPPLHTACMWPGSSLCWRRGGLGAR